MNLQQPNLMTSLLNDAIAATARDPRAIGIYGHLEVPGTNLLILHGDGRAVRIQKPTDPHLQKRTHSTKIHDNAIQKLTRCDSEGLPLVTFPLMASISPAGTDESNSDRLVTLNQAGVPGGLSSILQAHRQHNVTIVLLLDLGFRKWGFDRANRVSFTDWLDTIKQNSQGRFHYFLPRTATDPYVDRNFNKY